MALTLKTILVVGVSVFEVSSLGSKSRLHFVSLRSGIAFSNEKNRFRGRIVIAATVDALLPLLSLNLFHLCFMS